MLDRRRLLGLLALAPAAPVLARLAPAAPRLAPALDPEKDFATLGAFTIAREDLITDDLGAFARAYGRAARERVDALAWGQYGRP